MSSSDVGAGLFKELTATGAGDPYGLATFALSTAAAEGSAGAVAACAATFSVLDASGDTLVGGAAVGDAVFEELVGAGFGPTYADVAFETLAGLATAVAGSAAVGVGTFQTFDNVVTSVAAGLATGAGVFQPFVVTSTGVVPTFAVGDAALRALLGRATNLVGTAAAGAGVFAILEMAATGGQPSFSLGAATFERLVPYSRGTATQTTYRTHAMNVANEAVTEYQGFSYNSFAKSGDAYYAAGPAGLHLLDGDDDLGLPINWAFRTGFHDDKRGELKRMEEVLFSTRFDGPMRLRVWTDEITYFDYNVANHRANVLHQVRAKLGKGLRSRFFRIEVFGLNNTHAEFANMTAPMTQTTRRVG
jgi:hypothetical protein